MASPWTSSRSDGEPTDDLFSILVNAEVDGQRMSDDEIVFRDAADPHRRRRDHAAHAVGGTEQLCGIGISGNRCGDADLLPGVVEEMLRWSSP